MYRYLSMLVICKYIALVLQTAKYNTINFDEKHRPLHISCILFICFSFIQLSSLSLINDTIGDNLNCVKLLINSPRSL